jgi:hypothetical protein
MAVITRQHEYTAGNTIDPDENNANENALYNLVNGDLDNDNIASDAAIVESKISFNTTTGHSHDGTDSKLITINRGFSWTVLGTLATGDSQGAQFIVPENVTAVKVWYQTTSGTATIRLKKGSTTIIQSLSASSTIGSSTSFVAGTTSVTAGTRLKLDITAISSGVDLFVTLEATQP